jgi:predicted PurR-regulated permease PerM
MKMLQKQKITRLLVCALLLMPLGVSAGNSFTVNMPGSNGAQALPVPWQQSTITLSQLQSLVNQNPGQQLQIQFPNGMNWNVNQSAVQSMVSQYAQKASSLGLKQLPDVSFSSAEDAVRNAGGKATIPIQNAVGDMQNQVDAALNDVRSKENELRDQANGWLNSLPGWARTLIEAVINGFTVLYDFARDKVSALFR